MTHQYKDTILFNQKEFVLIDTEDGKLIYDCFIAIGEPIEKYRLPQHDFNSALQRHHFERYEIKNNQLWGQLIKQTFIIDKPNKIWREEIEYSELKPIPYTGSCVIGTSSYSDDWLSGYLNGDQAYELHFSNGVLDECLDLEEAIEFYNDHFLDSKFYEESDDQRSLHLKYDNAIAFHYLKYSYHPYRSLYWRFPENHPWPSTEDEKKERILEYEDNYQELLMELSK